MINQNYPDSGKSSDELWESYNEDPSIENKNKIIVRYLSLVRKIVLRMMPNYRNQAEYDDLLSNGVLGLMDAIDKFDSMRNVKFETYASKRIQGEILDYMRSEDWISSSMRTRIKKVAEEFERVSMLDGEAPSEQEVADNLDLSITQVREAVDNEYRYNIVYFESAITSAFADQPLRIIDTVQDDDIGVSPEQHLEQREMLGALTDILDSLPETEKIVIDLYYNRGLLLREIADVLDVSESRVSQIHTQAIKRIQKQVKNI